MAVAHTIWWTLPVLFAGCDIAHHADVADRHVAHSHKRNLVGSMLVVASHLSRWPSPQTKRETRPSREHTLEKKHIYPHTLFEFDSESATTEWWSCQFTARMKRELAFIHTHTHTQHSCDVLWSCTAFEIPFNWWHHPFDIQLDLTSFSADWCDVLVTANAHNHNCTLCCVRWLWRVGDACKSVCQHHTTTSWQMHMQIYTK